MARAGAVRSTDRLRLVLREPTDVLKVTLFSCLAVLGFAAAHGALWSIHGAAIGWLHGAALVVGVPLGGFVGIYCGAAMLQHLLHAIRPTRLDGDGVQLRVKAWNTWDGLLSTFRRSDATVRCEDIIGGSLSPAQGGGSELWIIHSSGLRFATGWQGSTPVAKRHAARLVDYLAGREAAVEAETSA